MVLQRGVLLTAGPSLGVTFVLQSGLLFKGVTRELRQQLVAFVVVAELVV